LGQSIKGEPTETTWMELGRNVERRIQLGWKGRPVKWGPGICTAEEKMWRGTGGQEGGGTGKEEGGFVWISRGNTRKSHRSGTSGQDTGGGGWHWGGITDQGGRPRVGGEGKSHGRRKTFGKQGG